MNNKLTVLKVHNKLTPLNVHNKLTPLNVHNKLTPLKVHNKLSLQKDLFTELHAILYFRLLCMLTP